MWRFVALVYTIPLVISQNDRRDESSWDIKLNVPGHPGRDYPTLSTIPRTSFSCAGREPGYYADQQAYCQVFRVCTAGSTYGYQSFLCPNGTLFNQAVFVCDWWMNVNCGKSQEIINNNNRERFGNLKLGPQLMKDVRKMITHPIRNPYNTGYFKNNFVVTQEYKPPLELYPNGALISSQYINTNNIYVPTKGPFRNLGPNLSNDISFAASTASPQYITFKSNKETQRALFANSQRTQNNQVFSNSYTEFRTTGNTPSPLNVQRPIIPNNNQRQTIAQFNPNSNVRYYNNGKQTHFESNRINQSNRPTTLSSNQAQTYNHKNSAPINAEAKQNLVSTTVAPTILSKTIAFKSILPGEKPGSPKSRITFKTWILKPKNAKLAVESKPFTNKNVIRSTSEISSTPTSYTYEKPQQSLDLTSKNNFYFYKQPITDKQETSAPYSQLYASPTTFRPTTSSRLYLSPNGDSFTTTDSPLYEISTIPNTYIPQTETEQYSRQYLSPLIKSQQIIRNEKLLTASSSQSPQYEFISPQKNRLPSYSVTKQSQVNTNHNNVSFTDILTQEKLDITVNDIVKDTNDIIQSASPFKKIEQYNNFLEDLKLDDASKEELTSKFPVTPTKSSKLISVPFNDLQPPLESITNNLSSNKLVNLPYYKQPVKTIERTVSIKITIPEKIAKILFDNDSSSDDLEILNTGSTNYLVYANNLATKSDSELTPIGKLSVVKNTNISNSQDLVFSFLADSLNAAKQYSNTAKQNIISSTVPPVQNYKYNNAEEITNKISQLTSAQYTNSNNVGSNNNIRQFIAQSQTNTQDKESTPFISNRHQNVYQQQRLPQTSQPLQSISQNSNQVLSGQLYQLPVPDVTREYYNTPNIKPSNNQQVSQKLYAPQNSQNLVVPNNKFHKGTDIEIIPSQQIPFSTFKQASNNLKTFNEQNDLSKNINSLITSENGITAQVQDSIVGTLTHPSEDDKLLTYKKDQSYYIFSQLNNNDHENNRINEERLNALQAQNVKNDKNNVALQFLPSVGYKLNDEKEKQRILNTFQINGFGIPKGTLNGNRNANSQDISTNIDYTIRHPVNYGDRLINKAFASRQKQAFVNRPNLRIEDLNSDEPNGYPKISPQPNFDT